jgi:hypothetical protein
MRIILGVMAVIALAGCRARTVDLGGNADGGGAGSSPAVGTWKGYVENFQFPSGSDTVTVTVTEQADQSLAATVTFGDKPAPPAPTDPNVGYPPGSGTTPLSPASIEGFVYTAHDVTFDGERLRLGVATWELWDAWCLMQQSYTWSKSGPPSYGCTPGGGGGMGSNGQCMALSASSPPVSVDCGKMELCINGACACSTTSCTGVTGTPDVTLDLQLSAARLDGSAATGPSPDISGYTVTPAFGGHNVHLTLVD